MTQNEQKIIFFFFIHVLTLYWDYFRLISKLKRELFFLKAFNITAAHSVSVSLCVCLYITFIHASSVAKYRDAVRNEGRKKIETHQKCTIASVEKLTRWRAVFWRQYDSKYHNHMFFRIPISCSIARQNIKVIRPT